MSDMPVKRISKRPRCQMSPVRAGPHLEENVQCQVNQLAGPNISLSRRGPWVEHEWVCGSDVAGALSDAAGRQLEAVAVGSSGLAEGACLFHAQQASRGTLRHCAGKTYVSRAALGAHIARAAVAAAALIASEAHVAIPIAAAHRQRQRSCTDEACSSTANAQRA